MSLELSCFFDDPADVSNLISGSSALSKSSLNIWKFTVHVFLKPDLESFEYYFNVCEMFEHLCSSLSILWHCLSLGLECKRTFSSPVATAEFSKFAGILSAALSQHHLVGFEVAKVEFNHLHWHQTPVLLPGKSHGWRSLVLCYCPWGRKELDTTERLHFTKSGKGQFSFQSQRKAMPENAQTTTQLHSSHMLVK